MKHLVLTAGVLMILGITALALLRAWPMINIVETGRTPEYPDIQPRTYRAPTSVVFDAALHAIQALSRWTLISQRESDGEIRAEATTRIMRFVDDVTIQIRQNGDGTRVEVRSASRVGRGDFGQNARNIRAFFDELDGRLQAGYL
jgi:uncharacterized protein (DUF1499 family)